MSPNPANRKIDLNYLRKYEQIVTFHSTKEKTHLICSMVIYFKDFFILILYIKVKVNIAESYPTLWDPMDYSPWNSQGQNTAVGSHSFLQDIFPNQGPNPGLPHCRWILYQLSHKANPFHMYVCIYLFSMGMVFIPVSCTMSQSSIHSSSGTLSIRSSPLSLFLTSTV